MRCSPHFAASLAPPAPLPRAGWWAYARKIHYTADIIMSFTWAACTGFGAALPYIYPGFFFAMIMHRYGRCVYEGQGADGMCAATGRRPACDGRARSHHVASRFSHTSPPPPLSRPQRHAQVRLVVRQGLGAVRQGGAVCVRPGAVLRRDCGGDGSKSSCVRTAPEAAAPRSRGTRPFLPFATAAATQQPYFIARARAHSSHHSATSRLQWGRRARARSWQPRAHTTHKKSKCAVGATPRRAPPRLTHP
jgi:hypothetical protein